MSSCQSSAGLHISASLYLDNARCGEAPPSPRSSLQVARVNALFLVLWRLVRTTIRASSGARLNSARSSRWAPPTASLRLKGALSKANVVIHHTLSAKFKPTILTLNRDCLTGCEINARRPSSVSRSMASGSCFRVTPQAPLEPKGLAELLVVDQKQVHTLNERNAMHMEARKGSSTAKAKRRRVHEEVAWIQEHHHPILDFEKPEKVLKKLGENMQKEAQVKVERPEGIEDEINALCAGKQDSLGRLQGPSTSERQRIVSGEERRVPNATGVLLVNGGMHTLV
ncbi:hypothetical protein PENSPDRAFT_691415 [Peniophora sp. CONT]|nr:hypothetical protein PENSPDRAFT_691415 [Peniophora sp. CONT]